MYFWCFKEPKKKDEMEESDQGLSILFKLFTEGSYQLVLEKIFSYFDGPDLVALQMASPNLSSFIQVIIHPLDILIFL